jgi:hypothetical protein
MKKNYSEITTEFLQLKVKKISNPCKKCLVQTPCVIPKCYYIRSIYDFVDSGELILDSHKLTAIIDATKDFNLGFNQIVQKSYSCEPFYFYMTSISIRSIQKSLLEGKKISEKFLTKYLKKYKDLYKTTKN